MISRSCILANGLSLVARMRFLTILYTLTPRGYGDPFPAWTVPLEKLVPIPGVVPSPRDLPPGCVFASRCSEFLPGVCDEPRPVPIIEVEPDHFVACYLYNNG